MREARHRKKKKHRNKREEWLLELGRRAFGVLAIDEIDGRLSRRKMKLDLHRLLFVALLLEDRPGRYEPAPRCRVRFSVASAKILPWSRA